MADIEELLRRRKELLEEIDREIDAAYGRAVTLMFTDIVGSTEYFETRGDIAGRQMIQTHNDLLFPLIAAHSGRVIKTIGDSIMASFDDPRRGAQCAVSMQETLRDYNAGREEAARIRVRMGLHYGKAVMDDRDLFGDMVNTSARVEARAGGEEILITGELKAQLEGAAFPLVYLGSDRVKGKQEAVDFYLINYLGQAEEELKRRFQARGAALPAAGPGAAPAAGSAAAPAEKIFQVRLTRGALEKKAAALPPLKRRGNPYLNRVMIPHPDLFYGRQAVIRRILSRISATRPQSISIVGERRIGKSSLLNFLNFPSTRLRMLENPESVLFCFIDFQQYRVLDGREIIALILSRLEQEYAGSLTFKVSPDHEGMRSLCEQLAGAGCRLIFCFDEFETVTKNERVGPEFYSCFRSLANNYPVAFITASGRNLKDMCVSHQIADSPFFNIFAHQHLGLFSEKEARALIAGPSEAHGLPLEAVGDGILALGGCYPFFLQIACASWFEFLESEGENAESFRGRRTPPEVLSAFREEAEPHFEYVLETLKPEESAALAATAGRGAGPGSAPHQEALARKGYLMEDEAGGYAFFSAEFERFCRRFLGL
jgi:class 3 adenylate cyclase